MFKKAVATTLIAIMLTAGCADNRNMPISKNDPHLKVEVLTYGLFDKATVAHPCVTYELAWGNLVWSTVFLYTVIVPVYMVGFSLYEPVSVDRECINN